MSGNAHEDPKISFEDSYDDYDDDSINATFTEQGLAETTLMPMRV